MKTKLTVKGEDFRILPREITKGEFVGEGQNYSKKFFPTGILCFRDYHQSKEWRDGEVSLELQLPYIIAFYERLVQDVIETDAEKNQHQEEQKEKDRLKEEYINGKEIDLEKFKKILNQSARWYKSNTLRAYIKALETRAIEMDNMGPEQIEWFAWINAKADWYDPFIEKEDGLLDIFDRNTLTRK